MSGEDLRPPVWVGHVVLETDRLPESAAFMRKLGMRLVVERPEVAVLELRGGTHLVLIAKPGINAGDAPFDLMVEDLRATHESFVELGLQPTPIERLSRDHDYFKVREPAGHTISIVSSHVSGQPV
jgi:catechol 2,3-dioxygenase-like lactoylglutathione lyase family enzyme